MLNGLEQEVCKINTFLTGMGIFLVLDTVFSPVSFTVNRSPIPLDNAAGASFG